MKKILFYLFTIATIVLGIRIVIILIRDLDRLTNYGYGYLTGIAVLFLVCLMASWWLGKKVFKEL